MCVCDLLPSFEKSRSGKESTLIQNKFQNLFEWHYVHNIHRRAKGHDFCTRFIAIKICNAIIVQIPWYSIPFQRNQNVPFSTLQNTQYQKKLACETKASLSIHSGSLTHSCTFKMYGNYYEQRY